MTLETISDLIDQNPLISFSREINKRIVLERFVDILDESSLDFLLGILSRFVIENPYRYWSVGQVKSIVNLLESDVARTCDALSQRTGSIERGFTALYRQLDEDLFEESLNLNVPRDLINLSSKYLPQYLRWAEHIYSSFLEFYWSIIKKGSVSGKFQLKGAIAVIRSKNLEFLEIGYDDTVRNAIAHGDFSMSPFGIKFGTEFGQDISIVDFQNLFDDLVRTCNSFAIALVIFWSRNYSQFKELDPIPISLITNLVFGELDRIGFKVFGAYESNTPLAGKQLHIAIELSIKKREQVLMECIRTAYHYIVFGATNYDRFVIQVNQKEPISSMVIIDPRKLLSLIERDSSIDDLADVVDKNSLLWFDEGKWNSRFKSWKEIFFSGIQWTKLEIHKNWHEAGIFIGKGRYKIREKEIISTQGISRIRIRAVLKNPDYSKNREIIRGIIFDIVSKHKRKLLPSREKCFDSGVNILKFPSYIWVDVYKEDGSLRWLKSGGWMAGNLVAVAEKVSGNKPPVLIHEPEDMHKNIRIRYSINAELAAKAYVELQNVIDDIWKNKKMSEN